MAFRRVRALLLENFHKEIDVGSKALVSLCLSLERKSYIVLGLYLKVEK